MTYNYPDAHLRTFIAADSRGVLDNVLRRVYVWMTLGLLLTTGVAAFVSVSPLFHILTGQPLVFFGLLTVELGLVVGISRGIKHISTATATSLFLFFAALNGLTLSTLFIVYSLGSIASTFLTSAALFGVMSILGYTTWINLEKVGTFLWMSILGLFLAMLANLFWANTTLDWIVTFAGILLFLGLTIFDTQRIRRMTAVALQHDEEDIESRFGIIGALSLYLDFVNLFLFLLRLGGRRH